MRRRGAWLSTGGTSARRGAGAVKRTEGAPHEPTGETSGECWAVTAECTGPLSRGRGRGRG